MLKSIPSRYGTFPVTIHWLSAMLIVVALGSGFQAENALSPDAKAALLRLHIPAALAVFLLTALRIVWWQSIDRKPLSVEGVTRWQNRLAHGVHVGFYIVILGMIASGIGMMVLSGAGSVIFGAADEVLPNFHLYAPRLPHGFGANLLLALLFAHVAAALYHHFIRRDGLLGRMWYGR